MSNKIMGSLPKGFSMRGDMDDDQVNAQDDFFRFEEIKTDRR